MFSRFVRSGREGLRNLVGNSAAINIRTGHMTVNPNNKGSGYDQTKKFIDHFAKVNDNYTITNCQYGYVVDVQAYIVIIFLYVAMCVRNQVLFLCGILITYSLEIPRNSQILAVVCSFVTSITNNLSGAFIKYFWISLLRSSYCSM